jgi:hypothetical protein
LDVLGALVSDDATEKTTMEKQQEAEIRFVNDCQQQQ